MTMPCCLAKSGTCDQWCDTTFQVNEDRPSITGTGRTLSTYDTITLAADTFLESLLTKNITCGLSKPGTWPFSRAAFSDYLSTDHNDKIHEPEDWTPFNSCDKFPQVSALCYTKCRQCCVTAHKHTIPNNTRPYPEASEKEKKIMKW
jgi:hypothetical protein